MTTEAKTGLTAALTWARQNVAGLAIIGIVIGALAAITMAGGCSLGDVIKVPVPIEVQSVTNSKASVTLNEAPFVREKYVSAITSSLSQFDGAIERQSVFYDFAASLLNTGITLGQETAANSGIPAGGFIALMLGGLGGLFIEKPGSKVAKAKAEKDLEDRGYDMGFQAALVAAGREATRTFIGMPNPGTSAPAAPTQG